MDIAPADVARIRELYGRGLYRRAHDVAAGLGPIRTWAGTPARLIGGRLAIQLGAPRLGRGLHLAAYRATPAHPEAVYYHARYRLEKFGPLAAWRFLRKHPDWSDAPPELHADWLALNGFVAARLRDFDRAERWLNRAEAMAPDRPWPQVERAGALELADRTADALQVARRALDLQPWFRPGIQSVGHLLVRLGRDREALDFLTEAVEHVESGLVVAQLAALQHDLGHHADAARSLDRYAELCPLMEPELAKWLAARRADAAYLQGDWPAAAAHARAAEDPLYTAFAERLETRPREGEAPAEPGSRTTVAGPAGASPSRQILPLDTSGDRADPPSPYDLLGRFWGRPFPDAPADAGPPADGLPDAAERARAEAGGWATREFALSADAAAALVGRGVPFVVTLVEAGFSQPRLVVGADPVKNTVFFAEPPDRRPTEAPLPALLDRFKATGPRCLAVVPGDEAARLSQETGDRRQGAEKTTSTPSSELSPASRLLPPGVLPDAEVYDLLYAVQKPLLTHDRPAAVAALDRLREQYPGHRLAAAGVLALARYDGHPVKQLAALDELVALFPHDPTVVMARATALRELNRLAERNALLEAEGSPTTAEPVLMQSLAQVLLPNPGQQAEVDRLLRRSVRKRSGAAAGYFLLATQMWERREFADAAEVYRFAATLDDREDPFADAYFRAARATDQVPEALRLFQQRAGRAAVPTPAAARALYAALMDRDEPDQAAVALEQAIRKLQEAGGRRQEADRSRSGVLGTQHSVPPAEPGVGPSSASADALGELLLFRAEAHAAARRFDAAEADLQAARPVVPPAAWHRAAARVARSRPDLPAAVLHTFEVLKHDPLSVEAHRAAAALLAETDGRAAARTHLGQACQRFPHYRPLLQLRAEFLSGDPDADADRAIQALLDESPDDAWAWRQRALVLAERGRPGDALTAAERAAALEPDHPWLAGVLAQVHRKADRTDEALAALRAGLRRSIDQEPLVAELVQLSRGTEEKQDALDFILAELRRQPHTGEGLVAYLAQCHGLLTEPDEHGELLEELQELLDDRPDLWHAWSATIQQMAVLGRIEEANALAREAADRFPLLAKLWLDRAQMAHAAGQTDDQLDALRQAVATAPGWSPAARELAEALDDAGENAEAIDVLRRNTVRSPLDPLAHGFLAEWLWEAGESREALDRVKLALRLEPGYDWAWHAVQLWGDRLDEPDEAADLARELTRERPGDPRVWLRLVRVLHHPRHNDEVLAALDKVVELDPRNVEAHDLRAERLAEMGRYDEALAAAKPPALATDLPFLLQGRLAWVEARRGNYAAAIPPMQALVAVDPKYVWGWHQLAEWYNETGRAEGYFEAASELVRLQPGHPVALTMRGEAKLQTGDRDGGKADLRDALKVSPNYSPAAAVLFDAHLADEEFREARQALAVLQEHMAGPEVAVKQLQYACKTGDVDGAVRAFAEVCEGPGQTPFPLRAGLAELKDAGWEERAYRVLRESWQTGGPFHPWAPIFWIDSPDGDDAGPDLRLRAAEAVVKAYPKFVPGHDSKAEQLAANDRFDEAIAACRPAELGEPVPVELRGRVAWIEAKRGDRAKAIAAMRAVVADFPSYVLGWRQLAAWYDAAGRYRDCLDASDQFVKLEPQNPIAYVYRGEAKRGVGDRKGARADFDKGFELDPGCEPAGLELIAEQLAAGDVAGATATLSALRENTDSPVVRLRAVQVACKQGNADVAAAEFRELAADDDAPRGTLREALAALDLAGWGGRVTDELKELAFAADANPDLAGLWAERAAAAGPLEAVADRLPELLTANPAAGREVILAYAWAVAEAGRPVQGVVQKYSEVLRADDRAWARAGAALVAAGHTALGSAWLADYRDRDGLEAWMLRPLATALRAPRPGRQGPGGVPGGGPARRPGRGAGRLPGVAGPGPGPERAGGGGRRAGREGGRGDGVRRHAPRPGDGRGRDPGRPGRAGREGGGVRRGEGAPAGGGRVVREGGRAGRGRPGVPAGGGRAGGRRGDARGEGVGPGAAAAAVGAVDWGYAREGEAPAEPGFVRLGGSLALPEMGGIRHDRDRARRPRPRGPGRPARGVHRHPDRVAAAPRPGGRAGGDHPAAPAAGGGPARPDRATAGPAGRHVHPGCLPPHRRGVRRLLRRAGRPAGPPRRPPGRKVRRVPRSPAGPVRDRRGGSGTRTRPGIPRRPVPRHGDRRARQVRGRYRRLNPERPCPP